MDFFHPVLTDQMIQSLPCVDTSEMDAIDTFVHDYSMFTKIINLMIMHKIDGQITPMLKMFTDVSTYIEQAFTTGDIFEDKCAEYSDGMNWLFNEISSECYSYCKGRFIYGAIADTD